MAHNQLVPVMKEKTVAPDNLLKTISCACKSGCRKNCGCRKLKISYNAMCTACNGQLCDNTDLITLKIIMMCNLNCIFSCSLVVIKLTSALA